jgi:FecR protein
VPHFIVDTPMLAAVVKGTTFTVVVDKDRSAVQVIEGAVEVAALDGGMSQLVAGGRSVFIDHDNPKVLMDAERAPANTPKSPTAVKVSGSKGVSLESLVANSGGLVRAETNPAQDRASPVALALVTPGVSGEVGADVALAADAKKPPKDKLADLPKDKIADLPKDKPKLTPPPVVVTPPAVTAPVVTEPVVTLPVATLPGSSNSGPGSSNSGPGSSNSGPGSGTSGPSSPVITVPTVPVVTAPTVPVPVLEPIVEPIVQPIVEAIVEPIVQPIVQPIVEPIVEPIVNIITPVVQPITAPLSGILPF